MADPRVQARFWRQVNKTDTCWVWVGKLHHTGYGNFSVNSTYISAHRYAYLVLVGAIADGLELDHLCRNRACVNPAHLEAVTHQVNAARGVHPGQPKRSHCFRGHAMTPDNVKVHVNGSRQCRTCRRAAYAALMQQPKWREYGRKYGREYRRAEKWLEYHREYKRRWRAARRAAGMVPT